MAFERVGDLFVLKPILTPWLEALAIDTKKPALCGFFVELNEYIIFHTNFCQFEVDELINTH